MKALASKADALALRSRVIHHSLLHRKPQLAESPEQPWAESGMASSTASMGEGSGASADNPPSASGGVQQERVPRFPTSRSIGFDAPSRSQYTALGYHIAQNLVLSE